MTAHELARKLLEGPDLSIYDYNQDASAPEKVVDVDIEERTSWQGGEPRPHRDGTDAANAQLPAQFLLIRTWEE